jgi:hypothetical protein
MATWHEERFTAIHLLRAGQTVKEVAAQLGRSERWVRKWRSRQAAASWPGLASRSRAPKQHGHCLPEAVHWAIAAARRQLEVEATLGSGLKYVGGPAVRARLRDWQVLPLPSVPTIERVLAELGLTKPPATAQTDAVVYPHLQPTRPLQLCQVDIVPHYLSGGTLLACFNALDVVSHYPTGQVYARQRAVDAVAFLLHVWQTIGIPQYTQVDNQDCFSGGHTHPYVLGQVLRLALYVGTELLFSPVDHPESNGFVERFHQDYNRHVWQDTHLQNQAAVQQQTEHFLVLYRQSPHQAALHDRTPQEVHAQTHPQCLDPAFTLPEQKLPLTAGRVHFIRRVSSEGTVSVLNVAWHVPNADPHKGVWVTIQFQTTGATLTIYDAAPDRPERVCLATYPFPLNDEVRPWRQPVASATPPPSTTSVEIPLVARFLLPAPATPPGGALLDPDALMAILWQAATRRTVSPLERCIDGLHLLMYKHRGTMY